MNKIILAIYAFTIEELNDKLNKLLIFSNDFQIDIMDGEFVIQKSFDIVDLQELPAGKNFEFHLMVAHPLEYLNHLKRLGVKKVVFHDEIDEDTSIAIEGYKKEGFSVFLTINPESEPNKIEEYILKIDGVMLMSVEPGKSGQKMILGVLEKAKYFHEKYPNLIIEMDGGINHGNIKEVFDAGVNIVVIGSGILNAENPEKEWAVLNDIKDKL